ncbi:MAG: response regulator [Chitinophagaceae bacterium]
MPSTNSTQTASILIIDDNQDMLAMLAVILRGRGYTVTAREKFEAIEKEISTLRPDLILIDKNLGWIDGCALCAQLRRFPQFASTIILIFSAYDVDPAEIEAAGADGYFEKPFGMQAFVENIEAYLAM